MRGLPIELFLILFFGAIVLFNIIRQRAAGRGAPEEAAADGDEQDPDDIPEAVWRRGSLEPVDFAEAMVAAPTPRRMPAPAAAAPATRRRRFDRQALLGTRRSVQDAFVVATILGRCRADEPHEVR